MSDQAILYDSSRCTACRGCQVACKTWFNLPSPTGLNENPFTGSYQSPMDLNGSTRLLISFHEEAGGDKGVKWAFGRRSCQHCGDAPCTQICPSGAVYKVASTGLVNVDDSKCIGCKFCLTACPYDVPRYRADNGRLEKCTGCADRIEQGLEPACVTTCQPEALQFGDRDDMLGIARDRVDYLQGKGFADAALYGEDQVGGLHVIQVLKHGVAAHGQVEDPHVNPVVGLSQIMKPVTAVAAGATVVGLAAMFALGAGYKREKMAYNPVTEDTLAVRTGEVLKHGDGQDPESVKEHLHDDAPVAKGGTDE